MAKGNFSLSNVNFHMETITMHCMSKWYRDVRHNSGWSALVKGPCNQCMEEIIEGKVSGQEVADNLKVIVEEARSG